MNNHEEKGFSPNAAPTRGWTEGDYTDLTGTDLEARRAYITQLIAVAADDARNLQLVATVAVAAVVFLAGDSLDKVKPLGSPTTEVALGSVVVLFLGALVLYWSAARVNQTRMELTRCLASSDAAKVRVIWAGDGGIEHQNHWILVVGTGLLVIGAIGSGLVITELILGK